MYDTGTDDGLGQSTYVSNPGVSTPAPGGVTPGSDGMGKSLAVHHAVIWLIAGAALGLVTIGVVFRRPIGQS
jgi:thiosulfate reductase cytochrome b subunit